MNRQQSKEMKKKKKYRLEWNNSYRVCECVCSICFDVHFCFIVFHMCNGDMVITIMLFSHQCLILSVLQNGKIGWFILFVCLVCSIFTKILHGILQFVEIVTRVVELAVVAVPDCDEKQKQNRSPSFCYETQFITQIVTATLKMATKQQNENKRKQKKNHLAKNNYRLLKVHGWYCVGNAIDMQFGMVEKWALFTF